MENNVFSRIKNYVTKAAMYSLIPLALTFSSCEKPEDPIVPGNPTNPPSSTNNNSSNNSNNNSDNSDSKDLYDNVFVFDASKLSEVYKYGDDKIYFENPLDGSYVSGSIIASDASEKDPFGMFVKLGSISPDRMSAKVSPASLEDALKRGGFVYEQQLSPSDIDENLSKEFSSLEGVLLKSSSSGLGYHFQNVILKDADDNVLTTDDQLRLNGEVFLSIKPRLEASVDYGLRAKFGVEVSGDAIISLESCKDLHLSGETTVWKKYLKPYKVLVGNFPVVITPRLSISVGAEGSAESEIAVKAYDDLSSSAYIEYVSGEWDFIKGFENEFNFQVPFVNSNASAKAYAEFDFDLLLYGGPGASSSLESYLLFDSDISKNPWWDMDWGLDLRLGFDPGFLSYMGIPEFDKTIFDIRNDIADAGGPFQGGGGSSNEDYDSLVLQPGPEGIDAWIRMHRWPSSCDDTYSSSGDDSDLNVSYHEFPETCGFIEEKSLLKFPLKKSDLEKEVASAKLMLYGHAGSNYVGQKPTFRISKLERDWDERITWDSEPEVRFVSETDLEDKNGNYWSTLDVTSAVKDWAQGEPNNGLEISTNEDETSGTFYSSDNPDSDKRPKLVIYYKK